MSRNAGWSVPVGVGSLKSCLLWTGVIQSAFTIATVLRPRGSLFSPVVPLVVPARFKV